MVQGKSVTSLSVGTLVVCGGRLCIRRHFGDADLSVKSNAMLCCFDIVSDDSRAARAKAVSSSTHWRALFTGPTFVVFNFVTF